MYFNEIKKKITSYKKQTEENKLPEQSQNSDGSWPEYNFLSGCKTSKNPLEFEKNQINLNWTNFSRFILTHISVKSSGYKIQCVPPLPHWNVPHSLPPPSPTWHC